MHNGEDYISARKRCIDEALHSNLPREDTRPALLHRAMRYSIFAGGKRIRPIICLASSEAVNPTRDIDLLPAIAIEAIHTASLIHDDLPALDNDDLRRGHPAAHVTFGVATAILAGDALVMIAFEWMAKCQAPPPYLPTQFGLELARGAGTAGLAGGETEDLARVGLQVSAETVDFIYLHKTAALFRACARIGAIAAGASSEELDILTNYGVNTGMAFQIIDDILNATSVQHALGKPVQTDQRRRTISYVTHYGLLEARVRATDYIERAVAGLPRLPGRTEPLAALAQFVLKRAA